MMQITQALLKRRLKGELVHMSTSLGLGKGNGVTYVKPNELV